MANIEVNGPLKITTNKKIRGFLESIIKEKDLYDIPCSYNLEKMFSAKGKNQPKKVIICSAIKNAGYKVVMSYLHPITIKTDAPFEFLRKIYNEWWLLENDPDFKGEISFTVDPEIKKMIKEYPPRFLPNPEKNWGPKSAAIIKLDKKNVNKSEQDDLNGSKKVKNE